MYEDFADFYDLLMSADYVKWIDSIAGLLPLGRGVDLACGTGKFTVGLMQKGFDVIGVDISPRMLGKAEENALAAGIHTNFICADMMNFVPIGQQDFCICMCDAVNYIKDPLPMFKNIHKYLRPGGIFVFDISSEYRLRNILSGNTFSETRNDVTYIWHNNKLRGRRLDSELTFFAPSGDKYIKKEEEQSMYLHEESCLKNALIECGFSVSVKGETPEKQKRRESERLHFICRRNMK